VKKITIKVKPRSYDALIESGMLRRAGAFLKKLFEKQRPRCFVVTAAAVRKPWGDAIESSLRQAGVDYRILEMREGERHKNFSTVEKLAETLVESGGDRDSVILALGGGVVGDVAGFLASVYMRGIACVQAPTTLLAQVDAAVGGKTGVNLRAGKNLLGTFHQPRAVWIDPAVLATLPERQYRSGLFESLKCGVIRNPRIFAFMEQQRDRLLRRDPAALEWLIAESVRVKAEVVAADERESDLRRILNFGHTIGHALEAETSYRHFLHGEAVAWGMVAAAMMAAAMRLAPPEDARRIISAVLSYSPLPGVTVRGSSVARRLSADKKTLGGVVHFVLPSRIGAVKIVRDLPERVIVQAVDELRYLSRV